MLANLAQSVKQLLSINMNIWRKCMFMPNCRTIKLLQTDNCNINPQFYIQDIHV